MPSRPAGRGAIRSYRKHANCWFLKLGVIYCHLTPVAVKQSQNRVAVSLKQGFIRYLLPIPGCRLGALPRKRLKRNVAL